MFKLLGRITWQILKLVAPPLGRRLQHRLTGRSAHGPGVLRRGGRGGRR